MVRVLCVNYADEHFAASASAAGATSAMGSSHSHGNSQHVLLSGLDQVSSPASSRSASASTTTAATNASGGAASSLVPQTYLFKLRDSKVLLACET